MIQGVIFDVDGTLVDSSESNYEFYRQLMRAAGYPEPTRTTYAKCMHLSTWDAIRAYAGTQDEKEIRRIWDMSQNLSYDPLTSIQLTEGAQETVELLSEKYRLGIATNRSKRYVFEGPLERLRPLFKTVVAFEDVLNHKPHPEPLLLAAANLGVETSVCVYVGDADTDIAAARAAGMKAIAFGADAPDGGDLSTDDFRNIPSFVERL